MVYGDDANFTKFGRIAHSAATNSEEKFEFIYENAGTPRNDAPDSTGQHPGGLPGRLLGPADVRRDERHRPLLDRRERLDPGRAPGAAAGERQDRPLRLQQRRHRQPRGRVRLVHPHGRRVGGPSRPELRRRVRRHEPRHRSLERDRPRHAGRVRGVPVASSRSPRRPATSTPATRPRRRTTSSSRTRRTRARTGRSRRRSTAARSTAATRQGGLIAYVDGDNYVKLDVDLRRRPDADQPHRAALGGRRRDPEPAAERRPIAGGPGRRAILPAADQDRARTTPASTRSTARRGRRSRAAR